MKKVINTITESGLFLLLIMIIMATTVSVLSLSPVAKEKQVTALDSETKKIAGISGITNETFIPYLASEGVNFGSQELLADKYSTVISFDNLKKGENKVEVVKIINSQGYILFEVSFNFISDVDYFLPYVKLGDRKENLSNYFHKGNSGTVNLTLNPGESGNLELILESEEEVNYPVEMEFTIQGFN